MGGMAGQLEVEPLIGAIRAAAKAVMRCELCTVFLVSDDRQSLIGRTSEAEGPAECFKGRFCSEPEGQPRVFERGYSALGWGQHSRGSIEAVGCSGAAQKHGVNGV